MKFLLSALLVAGVAAQSPCDANPCGVDSVCEESASNDSGYVCVQMPYNLRPAAVNFNNRYGGYGGLYGGRSMGFGYGARPSAVHVAQGALPSYTLAPRAPAESASAGLQAMGKKSTAKVLGYALNHGAEGLADTNLNLVSGVSMIQYAQHDAEKAEAALQKGREEGVTGDALRELELKAGAKKAAQLQEYAANLMGQSTSGYTLAGIAKNMDKAAGAEIAQMKLKAAQEKARTGEISREDLTLAENAEFQASSNHLAQVFAVTGNSRMAQTAGFFANRSAKSDADVKAQKAQAAYAADPTEENKKAAEGARLLAEAASMKELASWMGLLGNSQGSRAFGMFEQLKKQEAMQLKEGYTGRGGNYAQRFAQDSLFSNSGAAFNNIGSSSGSALLMYSLLAGQEAGDMFSGGVFNSQNDAGNLLTYALLGGGGLFY